MKTLKDIKRLLSKRGDRLMEMDFGDSKVPTEDIHTIDKVIDKPPINTGCVAKSNKNNNRSTVERFLP